MNKLSLKSNDYFRGIVDILGYIVNFKLNTEKIETLYQKAIEIQDCKLAEDMDKLFNVEYSVTALDIITPD